MKIKVKVAFRDKGDKALHKVDSVIDVKDERAEELIKRGYAVEHKEDKTNDLTAEVAKLKAENASLEKANAALVAEVANLKEKLKPTKPDTGLKTE